MIKRRLLSIATFLTVLLFGCAMYAQSDRATITGTVKDASLAVLPGVQVRVVSVGTNDVQITTTDNAGNYRVGELPIGNYTVSFSKDGFKGLERKGVTLLISQVAEINASLQVGGKNEIVEVTGQAPVLQTEDAKVSTDVDNKALSELPLNAQGSRNLSNFAFNFVPGVEGTDYSSHINGSMALSKEVMIDGTSAVSQLGGYISESQPPMEAIQEFQMDTAGIGSDEGRSGGGVLRYEMKSGTNKVHGSLFGIVHSTSLDALSAENRFEAYVVDPNNKAAWLKKSDSMSDWGGGFGGAIIKDKLFYYASFERYMQSMWNLGANARTVPTDAMMGLNSDGSVAGYADLSRFLTKPMVDGNGNAVTDSCGQAVYVGAIYQPGTGCMFSHNGVLNQVPTNLISTTTAKILQLYHKYYQPESSLAQNNAGQAYSPDPWFHNTQTSVKLDYNLSTNNHLNGSFYYDSFPRVNADQGGAWSAVAPDGGPLANSYQHNTTAPSVRLSDTYTFTPHVINAAHFTLNRFRNPSYAMSQKGKWDSYLGLSNGAGNFPLVVFDTTEYTAGDAPAYQNGWNFSDIGSEYNDFYAANTFIYNDEVDWSVGRHTFKFGAEFRALQFNSHPDEGTYNSIQFDPSTTAGAGWEQTGSAFGSFLLGDAYLATPTIHDPNYGRRKEFSMYAVDDFKVNSRLTLNLSLRWDYNNPYKEKFGHWSSFETQDKNTLSGEMGQYEYLTSGSQSFERKQDWYNYAPHVGAAYKLTDKTVVRGNYSIFFVPLNMNTWGGIPYGQTGNYGYYPSSTESNFQWDAGYQGKVSDAKTPTHQQWGTVSIDPRSLTPGNTQQWTVGVQREIARDTKVDVSWIQSHSYHLQSGTLRTDQPTVANMQAHIQGKTVNNNNDAYWGNTNSAYLYPYPQIAQAYGQLLSVGSPLGNSDYKSFQLSVTKRASHGLTFQGSYNWSRTHGDLDSTMGELWWVGALQNIYDLKDEAKGIADFDMTHIVKGYVTYDLPFGRGKMFLGGAGNIADKIVGGWSLTGDFHYNTGTPIQLHSNNSGYVGFNSVYANITPGCKLTTGHRGPYQQFLNTSCFTNPDASTGQLGTAGNFISQVRVPGMATEDLGVHKTVSMGAENRYNFTFAAEFFNVFNRHQLGGPDTNMNDVAGTDNPYYGQATGYGSQGGRIGQLKARFTF
jgi:hypothetical protein